MLELVNQAPGTGPLKREVRAVQAMIEAAMQGDRRSLARTLTALENRSITLQKSMPSLVKGNQNPTTGNPWQSPAPPALVSLVFWMVF